MPRNLLPSQKPAAAPFDHRIISTFKGLLWILALGLALLDATYLISCRVGDIDLLVNEGATPVSMRVVIR